MAQAYIEHAVISL